MSLKLAITALFATIIVVTGSVARGEAINSSRIMSVEQAFELSRDNKLILIDIRRPSEWQQTGIAQTAIPITMHQNFFAFLSQFRKATSGGFVKPIAIICARGVRTQYMQSVLAKHGYPQVIDVGAGMVGSRHGPGWLKAGLPTRPWPG